MKKTLWIINAVLFVIAVIVLIVGPFGVYIALLLASIFLCVGLIVHRFMSTKPMPPLPVNESLVPIAKQYSLISGFLAILPVSLFMVIAMAQGAGLAIIVLPIFFFLTGLLPAIVLSRVTFSILKRMPDRASLVHRFRRWLYVYLGLLAALVIFMLI